MVLDILRRFHIDWPICARVAELVDALVLGTSGVTRESSSLSFRTRPNQSQIQEIFLSNSASLSVRLVHTCKYR